MARLLASHEPAGIPGPAIGRFIHTSLKVEEAVPATGSAGDLFVCHPFLAHSINPASPRHTRVISNLAIHKVSVLDLDNGSIHRNPVEEAIVRALASNPMAIPILWR